jgi:hypothetical protein
MAIVLDNNVVWCVMLALACFFTTLSTVLPISAHHVVRPGQFMLEFRILVIPYVATVSWFLLGTYTSAINDSASTFSVFYLGLWFYAVGVIQLVAAIAISAYEIVAMNAGEEMIEPVPEA